MELAESDQAESDRGARQAVESLEGARAALVRAEAALAAAEEVRCAAHDTLGSARVRAKTAAEEVRARRAEAKRLHERLGKLTARTSDPVT